MPRKTLAELRDQVLAEIHEKSNKPRFCFMGYAPPLCIGDDSQRRHPSQPSVNPKEPLKVPFPAKGALFSSSQPLCIGDLYPGSCITRKPAAAFKKETFRPTGSIPSHLLGRIEYVGDPESKVSRSTSSDAVKAPFVPLGVRKGNLFTSQYEYMSPAITKESDHVATKSDSQRPAFKIPSGSASIPDIPRAPAPAPPNVDETPRRKIESEQRTPFRPGGGHVHISYPEYMSGANIETKSVTENSETRASWKSGSPDLVTSPIPSIVFLNLARGCS